MSKLKSQYDDLSQQHDAASLGMWLFLATEVLFFGGLFLAYIAYRTTYPVEFFRSGRELDITIGTINTAILLISSLFMALAVHAARKGKNALASGYLAGTWSLGFLFLALKGGEYYEDIQRHLVPGLSVKVTGPRPEISRLFYFIYYSMTGLHALHVTIGLGAVAVAFVRARRNEFSEKYYSPMEVTGLYWHFVDIVWIFLYPLLYLMGRSS